MSFRPVAGLARGFAVFATLLHGCGSSSSNSGPGQSGGGTADDASTDTDAGSDGASTNGSAPGTFNVFDQIPQFGIYVNADPNYTPPPGVLMWAYGTEFATKLTPQQQSAIGSDLAARITYLAQCDNYDRLGGIFFVLEPTGQTPQATDPRTELVRFITPFSDYTQGALAKHVYPDADISAYAHVLADPTHDVWIGIEGGSNPYSGDPCTNLASADFKAIGFKYSLDFVSTNPLLSGGASTTLIAVADVQETTVPVSGTFVNSGGSLAGHVTVIVSGHGSASGGDEYEHTQDTLTVGGVQVGSFSTQIDCAPFAQLSPDGNPGIFQSNLTGNPRNWCPGALVPSHSFPVTITGGSVPVSLGISPSQVPTGSYYATSIVFAAP
jgi:hypothetical protein